MPDLKLDTGLLDELDRSMATITDVLRNATALSRSTAGACGHRDLTDAVREFADDWEDTREDMLDTITSFSGMVHGVTDAFDQLESNLMNVLNQARNGG
jgi:ABC-type transporter Mla subunit MlaD